MKYLCIIEDGAFYKNKIYEFDFYHHKILNEILAISDSEIGRINISLNYLNKHFRKIETKLDKI